MTNPYEVLGVNSNASDEEVKSAYKELVKKYHPDNYSDSPLRDLAEEKMAQINTAYDQITKNKNTNNNATSSNNPYNNNARTGSSSRFQDVRRLIQSNRLVDAEEVLDGVGVNSRDAEWYFLKGSIYFSRGWLDDAMNHFSSACKMNPNNPEYRAAMNRMMWQRQGNFGSNQYNNSNPYRTNRNAGGCSGCDVCSSLICADCCCECMGGDLIACC